MHRISRWSAGQVARSGHDRARLSSVARLARIAALGSVLMGCVSAPTLWPYDEAALDDQLSRVLLDPDVRAASVLDLRFLVPYPVPGPTGVDLVVCRFVARGEAARPVVHLALEFEGEEALRAKRVLSALAMDRKGPVWMDADPPSSAPARPPSASEPAATIRIRAAPPRAKAGPRGLGDTLASCEIPDQGTDSDRREGAARPPPFLVDAEIVMRRTLDNAVGESVAVRPEEWMGALAHEIGHALGFQGHVRGRRSLMSLDQSHLRSVGRDLLAGKSVDVSLLEGLYALDAGQTLGSRSLSAPTLDWLRRIEAASAGRSRRRFARVGDRSAEWEWRIEGGPSLSLRFPYWADQLAGDADLIGVPTPSTRRLLTAAEPIEPNASAGAREPLD